MLKFIFKQFLYGKIYLWLKPRLSTVLFVAILIFLIFYFHNEYLSYLEFKQKTNGNYVGLSFVIKNLLIFFIAIVYFYFYFLIGKADKSINKSQEIIKKYEELNRVESLDHFLLDEEINKKK